MSMSTILANWKTSLSGLILILIGLMSILFDYHVPGFTQDAGTAIATGIGLLLAKDATPVVKAGFVLFLVSASLLFAGPAHAGDVATPLPTKAFKPTNPFAQPYDIGHCGAYFGINSIGTAGSIQGASVSPGTQVVQAGVGGVLGYGCPINAANGSFWFVEAMVDATNINGATSGISFSNAPVSFTERFGAGTPLQNMIGSIPGLASASTSGPAVPSLPALPNGVTAGPGAPYGFLALHQTDVSAQLGLQQNKQWMLSWGIGAGLLYRLSNGVVADVFAEYKIASNDICVGPLGNAGCAKFGPGFMTGVQFKY